MPDPGKAIRMKLRRARVITPLAACAAIAVAVPLTAFAAVGSGTIQGQVSGGGMAVTQLQVVVDGGSWAVDVAPDGSYSIPDVTVGTHQVQIETTDWSYGDFVANVTVTNGGTTTRDITYTTLSGTVTGNGAAPNAEVYVELEAPTAPVDAQWDGATTLADGSYLMLLSVDAWPHRLHFTPGFGLNFTDEYYDHAAKAKDATPITLSTTPTVIDEALPEGAALNGHVDLPAGSKNWQSREVEVRTPRGRIVQSMPAPIRGQHKGDYTFAGLAAGTYILSFAHASGYSQSAGTYYLNVSESDGTSAATPITLAAGQTKSLKAMRLKAADAGRLSGSIYKLSHGKRKPRANLRVVAVPTSKQLSTRNANTKRDGTFVIPGLSTGRYVLWVWNADFPSPRTHGFKSAKLGTYTVKAGKLTPTGAHEFNAKLF